MNGAIMPPIRLKEVQKPIPMERTTVGYTWGGRGYSVLNGGCEANPNSIILSPRQGDMQPKSEPAHLSGIYVNNIEVHGDQGPQQEEQRCEPKPAR